MMTLGSCLSKMYLGQAKELRTPEYETVKHFVEHIEIQKFIHYMTRRCSHRILAVGHPFALAEKLWHAPTLT